MWGSAAWLKGARSWPHHEAGLISLCFPPLGRKRDDQALLALEVTQVRLVAINDARSQICFWEGAGEDDRDVTARGQHLEALCFVGFAAAECQVIIGGELAARMRRSARLTDLV